MVCQALSHEVVIVNLTGLTVVEPCNRAGRARSIGKATVHASIIICKREVAPRASVRSAVCVRAEGGEMVARKRTHEQIAGGILWSNGHVGDIAGRRVRSWLELRRSVLGFHCSQRYEDTKDRVVAISMLTVTTNIDIDIARSVLA